MDKIKNIIAKFIKIDISSISNETVIDKSSINGSILVHRFYSELRKVGIVVEDYKNIRTYGDLLNRIEVSGQEINSIKNDVNLINKNIDSNLFIKGVGIDIEKVSNFPISEDFRNDVFYTDNFTSYEISYCILRNNPYESFAAIFSMKEAIYKSNNSILTNKTFKNIEIKHDNSGAPEFNGFLLSTSHTDEVVVSVAICYL